MRCVISLEAKRLCRCAFGGDTDSLSQQSECVFSVSAEVRGCEGQAEFCGDNRAAGKNRLIETDGNGWMDKRLTSALAPQDQSQHTRSVHVSLGWITY